ncbi:hypothetical protein OEA41_007193 [Lepraria neglecta]|uniref:Uncharacterized protein n=1 Tax=Lepraria neglecta TaxID=209136 RepID=A0AAE0DMR1_9LECA|nr:hypothetical protein OEA41_007193 [Lepraria neglecta]
MNDEVFDVHAIGFEEIHVPSQQDPETLAKSRLRDEVEHVTIGQVGDNVVYANSGGHGILRDLEQMKRTMEILMAKDEKRTSQLDEQQKQLSSLESRVRNLVQSLEGCLSI